MKVKKKTGARPAKKQYPLPVIEPWVAPEGKKNIISTPSLKKGGPPHPHKKDGEASLPYNTIVDKPISEKDKKGKGPVWHLVEARGLQEERTIEHLTGKDGAILIVMRPCDAVGPEKRKAAEYRFEFKKGELLIKSGKPIKGLKAEFTHEIVKGAVNLTMRVNKMVLVTVLTCDAVPS